MTTRNTSIAATAVCLSFNYCSPTQPFATSTMERLQQALPNKRNHGSKKKASLNSTTSKTTG